ncbi:deoxyribodipyrimidine photo-lyase [Frankia sp. CNm7]|uniref:Deoxyribodipyrimidine photo-lyase n=1 Tax=Frankia nepalensis TaxID=1836974 RepID=A0A937UQN7_9ACTN|nr:deoxyribodipyrimidine photo-lyase [Frankia nepalensis]MBL7500621.1 deoxyribodipyrimidine photo-lyase [Frankia nepalensis]MBL7510978.1 deoxyribodipyrimidine photo-lyase [Frankia nepalensis]MBL7524695.1 deoxyribodipyrimidine photo-lyase [Frankia nepalensis]MBL7630283.1 deoxyribodipyrimidine photo-lyase [Frankia nepalensis]
MVTTLAVFTRDLRVRDNPMLVAAAREAERVVPVFVLDAAMDRSGFAAGGRRRFLAESLTDLDRSLRELGGRLVLRAGEPVEQICRLADEVDAARVHIATDSSAHAHRREAALRSALSERRRELRGHDEVHAVVAPGRLRPAGRDHFAVFGAYHRRWSDVPWRRVLGPPERIRLPELDPGALPPVEPRAGTDGFPGGERAGLMRAERWLGQGVEHYDDQRDRLAADGTSRLSPYLHLGCLSALELATRAGAGDGAREFVRQLAWRDFFHQLLDARPDTAHRDYGRQVDDWRDDPEALEAWRTGHTGVPVVDAGMRQLLAEGWLPNRARMITASFLTRTLGIDWRAGAAHYLEHLVDGDLANNNLNWQWVAGTGTDRRPGRVLNPLRQAERYDPDGAYVRRHVPELADLAARDLRQPWRLPDPERRALKYPAPLPGLADTLR